MNRNLAPELLVGALRSKRLTLLYGAPGPWRDGLLRRGVMPILQQSDNGAAAPVAAPRSPSASMTGRVAAVCPARRIDAEFRAIWSGAVPLTLAAHLRAIEHRYHGMVLLVLDASSVTSTSVPNARHRTLRCELAECITHDAVPLH